MLQDQTLTTINFAPGIVKELTPKAAEGYWVDGDKIRFRFGKPELMGGWQNVTNEIQSANLIGIPRALETVRALDGTRAALIGTDIGLFSSNLSSYNNVTPLVTAIPGTDILSTLLNSTQVIVSVSAHGLTEGTFVAFVSANTTIGGNILINAVASTTATFQAGLVDANSFSIDVGISAAATSALTGGDITVLLYANAGTQSDSQVGGWGGGVWSGNFGWSEPTGSSILLKMRQWSLDQWGTEIMAVPSMGPLYLWSPQNGITSRAALITVAPSINQIVRVATEARHVILYGTHDISGTYDPLLIRWCSQEDYDTWTPALENTAGDFRLASRGSEIVAVIKTKDQHVILTDADMFTQNYIGSNDVFGFSRAGEACGIIAQNAGVEYGGSCYWMGNNGKFFKYDGRIQPLHSTVLRYVFEGIDGRYKSKIFAGTNSQFDEIIFFYTSHDSLDTEPDRYVIVNVAEPNMPWVIGTMRRTTWKDRSTFAQVLATGVPDADHGLNYQETGYAAGTAPMESFLQSAYFDSNSGDTIMFCNKYVPDFKTPAGDPLLDAVEISLLMRKYPGGDVITKGPYLVTGATQKVSTRLRGREMAMRLDATTSTQSTPWRMGETRFALQDDGQR